MISSFMTGMNKQKLWLITLVFHQKFLELLVVSKAEKMWSMILLKNDCTAFARSFDPTNAGTIWRASNICILYKNCTEEYHGTGVVVILGHDEYS